MKEKKMLSWMIACFLVIGGFAVISGTTSAQEGDRVTEIEFGITFDIEDGAIAASEGETHLFMHSVDGPIWQGLPAGVRASLDTWEVFGSYNNWFLNPAHEGYGTVQMDEAVTEGWIDDPEDVMYLANNYEDEWTVNPFAHNDIRFAMQYLNREGIVEDLLLGWGDERYGPMATALEVWQERFVERIEEKYDLSPEGEWSRVEQFVEWGMEDIQDHVAAHPGMGEVTGSMEDGWYYDHPEQEEHQIEIIIMAREEDWRENKGDWTASRLEELGFDVTVDPTDSASANPQAFYGDPHPYDDLGYHIYTGGWPSTGDWSSMTGGYYLEEIINEMHMPWAGFMQTYDPEDRWNMDDEMYDQPIGPSERVRDELGIYKHEDVTVEQADLEGMDLFTATGVEEEEDYWEMMYDTSQRGFEHAVRVFAITEIALYPYNPDRLIAAVPESINGYDTYFGPRTMRTDDGTLETDILSGVARPYMDNWNIEEGSADVYGEYQRRLAREYGSWPHPQTGMPMQVNTYWVDNEGLDDERTHPFDLEGGVETDYEYDAEGELEKHIEVPDTATDYVPAIGDDVVQEWLSVDEMIDQGYLDEEDEYAAVEVTLDIHDLHVWHDGTPFDLRDVMTHHANRRELGYEQTEPYNSGTDASLSPGWDTVIGYEWNLEEGTVTVYGDYTFPIDDKIGDYFSIFPWDAHPITYFGWNQLHAGEDYNYETGVEGQEWIHQLSEDHSEDMIAELEAWVDAGDLPTYLDAENMPEHMEDMAYSVEKFGDIVDSLANFVDERGHAYIGLGPYIIEDYDDIDHDMEITTWDGYGYPMAGESANDMFDRLEDNGYYEDIDRDAYLVDDWDEDEDPGDYVFQFGYWSDQFIYEEIRFDIMEVTPDELQLWDDPDGTVDVFVDATWESLFPDPEVRALTEDDLDDYFLRLAESERGPAVEVDGEPMELDRDEVDLSVENGFSTFSAQMDLSDLGTGIYSMEFRARAEEDDPWTMIARDVRVEVAEEHTLTFDIIGEGSVNIEDEEYEEGDTLTFDPLQEVEIAAIPDDDWEFDRWMEDVPLREQLDDDITLVMEGDKEIIARFKEKPEYDLTINVEPEEGGTTDPEPGTYTYPGGELVNIEAISDDGWVFKEWTGDDQREEKEITIYMDRDKEVTAQFEEAEETYIEITPEESTIQASETEDYVATVYDQRDNPMEEVTEETHWSIEDGAGGSWNQDAGIYTSENDGVWNVTGEYNGMTDYATLIVEVGDVEYIDIYPSSDFSLDAGQSEEFTAEAYDSEDNLITDDVTDFSWTNIHEIDYEENVAVFYKEEKGNYDVTAEFETVVSQTITVTVEPLDTDYVEIYPDRDQIVMYTGEEINFSAEAYDEYHNLIEDEDTEFTWNNTDEYGQFLEEETADHFPVNASYGGVTSDTVRVTLVNRVIVVDNVTVSEVEDMIENALDPYLNESEINNILEDYITEGELTDALENYLTQTEINELLEDYVTNGELTAALEDYMTIAEINDVLEDYITSEEMFSLSRTEYEQYLEEGTISPELRKALEEEGYYVDEDAELFEENGTWFISENPERKYRIKVAEDELKVYRGSLEAALDDYLTDEEIDDVLAELEGEQDDDISMARNLGIVGIILAILAIIIAIVAMHRKPPSEEESKSESTEKMNMEEEYGEDEVFEEAKDTEEETVQRKS